MLQISFKVELMFGCDYPRGVSVLTHFLLTSLISVNTWAATDSASIAKQLLGSNPATDKACAYYNDNCFNTNDSRKTTDKCTFNETTCHQDVSNSDNPCASNKATTTYNDAKSKFEVACSQANVPLVGQDDIGCGIKMTGCRCLNGGSGQIGQVRCDAKGAASSSGDSDVPDSKQAAAQYKTCPALASRDNSDSKDSLKEAEKDARADQDKVNEAQEKVSKAQEDASTKQEELADKATEAQSKYSEEQEAAQKEATDAQKGIMDQLSALQNQSLALDEQIGQQQLQLSQAAIERDKQKTQVELNCHAQATATVSKFQGEALELNRAGRLNLGGQKDILKKVGLSDRQHWEVMAMKYYTWCLQSKPTLEQKNMADRTYTQQSAAVRTAISDIKKRKAQLADQMKQVKDPNERCASPAATVVGASPAPSCPPAGSQYCQSLCQAAAKQNRLFQTFQMTNAVTLAKANAQKLRAEKAEDMANQQVGQAQSRLNEDNARVNGLRSYLAVTRDAGGGSSDGKGYANVLAQFNAFTSAAQSLVQCTNSDTNCNANTTCLKAKRYLDAIGSSVEFDKNPTAARHDSAAGPAPRAPSSESGGGDSAREQ